MMGRGRNAVKLALKCLLTAVLLWVAFRSVDVGAVSRLVIGLSPAWAACALLLTGIIIATDAALLSGVLRMFGRSVPFVTALLYSLVGWFFSNIAPSTVGGDVFRGVQLSRVGVPLGQSIRLVIAIRVLSFTTLVAVMLAGFPVALQLVGPRREAAPLGTILAGGMVAVGALFLLAQGIVRLRSLERFPVFGKFQTIANDFRMLLVPSRPVAVAWLAALTQHLIRIGILAALATGLKLDIPILTLFAFTPAALLMAMLPISLGGWGVRELTFVYFLGTAGVSSEAAISLSIVFGLLRLVVGAIGGVTWTLVHDDRFQVDPSSA
jgi:uncharacterized membrane protein YbhN (UPF0104 family)